MKVRTDAYTHTSYKCQFVYFILIRRYKNIIIQVFDECFGYIQSYVIEPMKQLVCLAFVRWH